MSDAGGALRRARVLRGVLPRPRAFGSAGRRPAHRRADQHVVVLERAGSRPGDRRLAPAGDRGGPRPASRPPRPGTRPFVDNRGNVLQQTSLSVAAVLYATVSLRNGATLYERGGDLPTIALALLAVAAGWALGARGSVSKRTAQRLTGRASTRAGVGTSLARCARSRGRARSASRLAARARGRCQVRRRVRSRRQAGGRRAWLDRRRGSG